MHEKKQCFIPASAKSTRTHHWEQLLLSVVAVFFLFLEQFGIVSRLLQTLIVTMLCKQKVL